MKTTIEIQTSLFRAAKMAAAARGLSLKQFLTEALKEKLSTPARGHRGNWPVPPPQVARGELQRLNAVIETEFSQVEAEEWK